MVSEISVCPDCNFTEYTNVIKLMLGLNGRVLLFSALTRECCNALSSLFEKAKLFELVAESL